MVRSVRSAIVCPVLALLCLWLRCDGLWSPFLEYRSGAEGAMTGNFGDSGGDTDCKDVVSFKTNAVPAMQTCMIDCHGGTNPQAKGTMDLSKLKEMTPTSACIEVRARITPGNPDASPIVRVTNPLLMIVHMYKFGGLIAAHNDFKSKVSPWIVTEQ